MVDTPGLADGTGNEEEYLQKIKEKVTVFDAFIFCTEMNTHRFRNDDIKTVQKLTEAFGSQLWEHAVVVLTFANEVHPPPSKNDVAVQEFFDQRVRIFRKKIQEVVLNVGVPEGVVINLPLVPAGDLSEPRLPGIDNWFRCFWITTFKRLNRSARPTFFLANITRFDCVSSSQEEIQTLNRSKCMTEPKQRTPPKPRPKPKPKRSGNGQGVTVDAPVSIDLDEPSAKEIIMEIIHEVGKEASKVVGDLIRPGTGRVWSDVFAWVMTLVKGWLKENPAKKNDVVEEEGEQEED